MLPYIKIFCDLMPMVESMADDEAGRLLKGLLRHANGLPDCEGGGAERYALMLLNAQIDRDAAAYDDMRAVNAANGAKGGRPKKRAVISETGRFSEKTEKSQEEDKDKDEDQDEEKDEDEDKDNTAAGSDVVSYARRCLPRMSEDNITELEGFREMFTDEMLRKAVNTTNGNGSRSWVYCRSILLRWAKAGHRTPAEVDSADDRRRAELNAAKTGARPMITRAASGDDEYGKEYYDELMGRRLGSV